MEPRALAAPYFYRTSDLPLSALVGDFGANSNPLVDYETNFGQVSATETQDGVDGLGNGWTDTSSAGTYEDDGGITPTGTGVATVSANHLDQGQWRADSGPANDQSTQALFANGAYSGIDPSTGMIVPITWVLAMPASGSGPDPGPLPAGEAIQTVFSANYTFGNPDNHAEISLLLLSSTMNVAINTAGPGIVITDPNSTAPGITLPYYYAPPAGSVTYFDPNFGGASTDVAAQIFNTPIAADGPFPVFLSYASTMHSPQVHPPGPPDQPDLTHYQDLYTWTIAFHPLVQTY